MTSSCPKCGQANRAGAKFCAVCGAALAAPAGSASAAGSVPARPGAASPSAAGAAAGGPGAAPPGAGVGPAVAKAGAALAPVARQAAAKGWAGSKRSMSFLARVVTVGGRAAYSELFGPLPVAGGQVATSPTAAMVPAPFEFPALLFVLVLLGEWLVFALPSVTQGIVILAALMALLLLSWLGFRRPYFTVLTLTGLIGRLRNRGRPLRVPIYKFQVVERTGGQPLDVVMIGPQKGVRVAAGAIVELWGVRHPGRNELRAWRVESVDATGQSRGVLTVPRLIPLTVALFLPVIVVLATWLVDLAL